MCVRETETETEEEREEEKGTCLSIDKVYTHNCV